MDCRSNICRWQKIFAYHLYLIKMCDLKSRFRFAIKWYGLALCIGPNHSRKKKTSSCAGWLWIIATTLVYCQKVTPTTYTLYSRMTYASTSVVGKNVATEYQSLYNVKIFFSRKKNVDLDRMVTDCRSNLRRWQKIFTCGLYLVKMYDLKSKFRFEIKLYGPSTMPRTEPFAEKKIFELRRMVMDCSSNLSLLPKSDTCHVYLVPTNDLQSNFRCWEKCSTWVPVTIQRQKKIFAEKKRRLEQDWSWTAGPTFVFEKKSSHATCTL